MNYEDGTDISLEENDSVSCKVYLFGKKKTQIGDIRKRLEEFGHETVEDIKKAISFFVYFYSRALRIVFIFCKLAPTESKTFLLLNYLDYWH